MKRLPWRQFRQSLESDLGSKDEGQWGPDEGPRQPPPPSAAVPVPWSLEVGRNCFWKLRFGTAFLPPCSRWTEDGEGTAGHSGPPPAPAPVLLPSEPKQDNSRRNTRLHEVLISFIPWPGPRGPRRGQQGARGSCRITLTRPAAHSPRGGRAHSVPQTLQLDPLRHKVINGGFFVGLKLCGVCHL